MRKLNRVLSTCLLTATVIVNLPHWFSSVAIAQTNSRQQSWWWEIFQNDPPVEDSTPGGRRDISGLCAIAPRSIMTNTKVWSDRPLFVWRGNLGKIEVHPHKSDEVLWSQTVTSTDNSVTYAGEALQPGQTYDWVIFSPQNSRIFLIPFQVMEAPERDRIRVRLTILEQELKEKGATPEEIANARANYFAQQQLWSDVLKEVYSIENPSPELETIIQEIPSQLCKPMQRH
ncbi:MAG: hypothetical protein LDL41_21145 [Coleofasciculus sp. S288]|nr:hypothetical protein [Coleofasciculus sp. S288]